jgi:hypothetical protein
VLKTQAKSAFQHLSTVRQGASTDWQLRILMGQPPAAVAMPAPDKAVLKRALILQ